ncbi:helix-turn-helix domain-containing protein [Chloroflexota bacterium]
MPKLKYQKDPKMWEDSLTLNLKQAARLLGISPNNALNAAKAGYIPYIRIGRLYRVPKARLMAMINGNDDTKQAMD